MDDNNKYIDVYSMFFDKYDEIFENLKQEHKFMNLELNENTEDNETIITPIAKQTKYIRHNIQSKWKEFTQEEYYGITNFMIIGTTKNIKTISYVLAGNIIDKIYPSIYFNVNDPIPVIGKNNVIPFWRFDDHSIYVEADDNYIDGEISLQYDIVKLKKNTLSFPYCCKYQATQHQHHVKFCDIISDNKLDYWPDNIDKNIYIEEYNTFEKLNKNSKYKHRMYLDLNHPIQIIKVISSHKLANAYISLNCLFRFELKDITKTFENNNEKYYYICDFHKNINFSKIDSSSLLYDCSDIPITLDIFAYNSNILFMGSFTEEKENGESTVWISSRGAYFFY